MQKKYLPTNLRLFSKHTYYWKNAFVWMVFCCFNQSAVCQPIFKGIRENLGREINDAQNQTQPVFSTDGSVLYFSNGSGVNQSAEIWRSVSDSIGHIIGKEKVFAMNPGLQQPKYMLQAMSSHQYLLSGVFVKYNNSLQYSRGMSMYDSKKVTSIFSLDNYKKTSSPTLDSLFRRRQFFPFYQPFSMVYIWSQRDGNQSDIYLLLNEHSTDTSKPKIIKLPAPLNTTANEITPWMDDESRFLYFASDRPGGFGELDIYASERLDNTWEKWSAPKNLGPTVNSNKNDFNFIIDPTETYGYFASNKNGFGGNDLYRIQLGESDAQHAQNNLLLPTDRPDTSLQFNPNIHLATSITFLLDISNSMAQNQKIILLKKTLFRLIQQLRPIDKVSIVIFGSGAEILINGKSAKDKSGILDVIKTLSANGNATNIGAGLNRAYETAVQHIIPQGNNQLYLVTDGIFKLKPADEKLMVLNPNIKLTVVEVGNESEMSNAIAPLIEKVKGRLMHISNAQTDINALLNDVRNQAAKHN